MLIDESTDISSRKLLCICARYFSHENNSIKTVFLGLVSVISTTGENLFNAIKQYLEKSGIDIKNCIGFSSDGANNVCGINNSVLSRLRSIKPNLVFVKCICHSLALCCLHANKKLPSNIDYLLSEIARWFKFSSIRQDDFKVLFKLLNDDCIEPSAFITPSSTRWLVKGKCIFVILSQWEELKSYFNLVADKERNFHARIIFDMLSDERNFLYLHFILPIIQDFERVNAAFQATNANLYKIYQDLDVLHRSIKDKIKNKLFGAKFEMCLNNTKLPVKEKEIIKERCLNFLTEANSQLDKRRDDNSVIVTTLELFHPQACLSQVRPNYQDLPKAFHDFVKNEDTTVLSSQYEKLIFINWEKEFNCKIPTESVEFWSTVLKYKNALGEHCFKEFAQVVLNILSLPISNAFVERVFSFVTNAKSKQRNKLSVSTLESILHIKSHLMLNNKCCKDFIVTAEMRKLFNSDMYKTSSQSHPSTSSNTQTSEVGFSIENEIEKEQFEDICALRI